MRRRVFIYISIWLNVFIGSCSFSSYENTESLKAERIDSNLSAYVTRPDIAGFGIGIIFHNQIFFSEGYGYTNIDTRTPVTTRSLFHMASISKPFVATSIMELVEEGKIALDDKVSEILPYFSLSDPRFREITIGQMLSHLSGMPDVEDYEWDKPQYDEGAVERYVRSLSTEKLISEPGEQFHYSNMAFDILADVIAKVSGAPFEDFVATRILLPSGMRYSTFLKNQVPDSLSTSPHVYDLKNFRMGVSKVYPYNRQHAGSSTLHSNVEDMIRWAFINLYKGESVGGRILKKSSFDQLVDKKFQIGGERYIGLSWFISRYRGKTVISHSGGDTGYRSFLLMIPEDTTAIITMGNSDNFQSYGVARQIVDILYNFPVDTLKEPASFKFLSIWGAHGLDSAFRYFNYLKDHRDPFLDFDDSSLITLAWPLHDSGQSGEALQLLDYNRRLFPGSVWNYQFKAEILYHLGRKEEAILSLQDALEINPDDDYSLNLLKQYKSD
jgi:CubicO group peptidase (beta-lactamase class C family)